MATWPTDTMVTTHTDAGTDDPSQARVDINKCIQAAKDIIACRAAVNGIPSLDGSTLIPSAQLPVVPISKGGTGATDAATARTNLGAQAALGFTPVNIAGDTMTGALVVQGTQIKSEFVGSSPGKLALYGNKAVPVAADVITRIMIDGNNDLGVLKTYAQIDGIIIDPANAGVTGQIIFRVTNAGFQNDQIHIHKDHVDLVAGVAGASPGALKVGGTTVIDSSRNLFGVNLTITGTPTLPGLTDGSNADGLHVHATAGITLDHADLGNVTSDQHHAESHDIASHSNVTITAAATGEILRFDGADWVDYALAALDSSDSSVLGVLRAIDAAGNVVFNEEGLDLDFRMESDTLTHAFFLQGSDGRIGIDTATPLASFNVKKAIGTLGPNDLAVLFGTDTRHNCYIIGHTINSGFDDATDDAGIAINYRGHAAGATKFRDFTIYDGKGSEVFDVDGSAAAVKVTGDMEVTGEIKGDLMLLTFARAVVPQMNAGGESLELHGILCTAAKGFHVVGAGSIVAMGINYNVDASVGGAAMEYGVAVDGGSVFAEATDEAVGDNKVEEAIQARGTDTVALDDNLGMYVAETGGQNLDVTDVLAWVLITND